MSMAIHSYQASSRYRSYLGSNLHHNGKVELFFSSNLSDDWQYVFEKERLGKNPIENALGLS